ncbi:MAG: hypothetical protein GY768_09605 [Planctomycetaceae bacterium]|nr:hypothetical protein [Planctomycetaceae bacterium]
MRRPLGVERGEKENLLKDGRWTPNRKVGQGGIKGRKAGCRGPHPSLLHLPITVGVTLVENNVLSLADVEESGFVVGTHDQYAR